MASLTIHLAPLGGSRYLYIYMIVYHYILYQILILDLLRVVGEKNIFLKWWFHGDLLTMVESKTHLKHLKVYCTIIIIDLSYNPRQIKTSNCPTDLFETTREQLVWDMWSPGQLYHVSWRCFQPVLDPRRCCCHD